MYINVVGIIKNSHLNTVGYRLLDTDDNNKLKDVTKAQLLSVLQKKLLNVENIELVNNKTIRGKYYSLELLPKIFSNSGEQEYSKLIALCIIDNTTIKVASCTGNVAEMTPSQLKNVTSKLVNITPDGIKCPKIETRYSKNTKSVASSLDAEAIDPRVVWSFKDFDKFMKIHNYSYTIKGVRSFKERRSDNEIATVDNYKEYTQLILMKIDDNCKIVHLPKELYYVEGMYDHNRHIDYLILPSSIVAIEQLHTDIIEDKEDDKEYKFSIKHFYTQNTRGSRSIMRLDGIKYIDFQEPLIIQNWCYSNAFNNCNIQKLLFNGTVESLIKCFNKCVFTETSCIDFANIDTIDRSFCDINIKKATFSENIRIIEKSFNRTALNEIQFKENNNIAAIRESFEKCNITKVDLSNLHELKGLETESFMNNGKLKDVILNKELEHVCRRVFSNCAIENIKLHNKLTIIEDEFLGRCPIKKIELPENIEVVCYPIGGKDTVVKYTGINKELTSNKIHNLSEDDKYDFGEVFTELHTLALERCNADITLPASIRKLNGGSFNMADMSVYDTLSTPNVSIIPSECFTGKGNINTVILNDNIKDVCSHAFYRMGGINKIIISAKASGFKKEAFSGMDTEFVHPIFYVVSSNESAKKFLNDNDILFKEIDSIEDVMKTNDDAIATYKLIYGGDQKYSEFFEEPYINDIDTLMNVSDRIDRLDDISFGKNKLDTTKFRELDIETYYCVQKFAYDTYEKMYNYCKDKGVCKVHESLTDKFIGTANLFTRLFDNNAMCYTEEFIYKFSSAEDTVVKALLTASPNGSIIVVSSSLLNKQSNRLDILMITIGDKIVFQTVFDNNSDMLPYETYSSHNHSFKRFNKAFGIADLFDVGDYIIADTTIQGDYKKPIRMTVNGAILPQSLIDGALKTFIRSCILVGVEPCYVRQKAEKTLFYDCVQQKFLEIRGEYTWGDEKNTRIMALKNGTIQNIYDLSDFDKIDKRYFEGIRYYNSSDRTNNLIRYASSTRQDIARMFNDTSQYDTDGNVVLCVLADYIYKNKITSKNELNIKLLQALLSNNLFLDYYNSIKWCKQKGSEIKLSDIKGTSSKLFSCFNEGYNVISKIIRQEILLCYDKSQHSSYNLYLIEGMKFEILCIVNDATIETKKIQLKICPMPLNDLIKALYTVGERRANNPNKDKAACKITNKKVDMSNYVILYTMKLTAGIENRKELLLALDKLNCDTYLIIGYSSKYFYTLLRFKDIISGFNLIRCKSGVTSSDFEKLADSNFISEAYTKSSELQEVRDAIMNGYPDNYPYTGRQEEIFKSLAKQPK